MNKKYTTKTVLYFGVIVSLLLQSSCRDDKSPNYESKRTQNFNSGWAFLKDDIEGAEKPDFDDSGWRVVDLPHDFSIEDYDMQDSMHIGPFFKGMYEGDDVGYFSGGIGWYRKELTIDEENKNKQVFLHFDGVQSEMQLWINGGKVGNHVYGYTPFYFNITPFLNKTNQGNHIAIRVVNPERNTRWFSGAGIYRPVWISFINPVHVDVWGLSVTTPLVTEGKATVNLHLIVRNMQETDAEISIQAEIISPTNVSTELTEQQCQIKHGEQASFLLNTTLEKPELWSIEKPNLYTAKISILQNGEKVDEYVSPFGIRSVEFSADKGFLLNGKEILLKGACMHHDNGLLGAAAFDRAEERRVQIMKANGYNAIRTSHNPPSNAFLNACDRLGMLVIDETFDMWVKPKRPNDYHRYFNEWWKKDIQAMLLRDRNHPSVFMWSIGNEIQERADSSGLAIAKETIEFIMSVDSTRPVSQAICDFWDNPGKEWDYSAPAFELLDIGGYNYQWSKYEKDHEKFSKRIMYGSESVAQHAFENWQKVEQHPYVIGDFVWTGMDYIGESGIGHTTYQTDKNANDSFLMPWPWYISWCGDIDITGNKKPQSYYRDVIWNESKLEMVVHEPVPDSKHELISFWGWPKELQSWNWQGNEGKPLQVSVYSFYPKVRLELNGEIIGEQEVSKDSKLKVSFTVPYQAGELKVTGIENGRELESKIIKTTGSAMSLELVPERKEIKADRNEIVFIPVLATDEEGNIVPDANVPVTIKVLGEGELISAGNASPFIEGSLQDGQTSLYNGRALVIARSTGKSGSITVEVKSENLKIVTTTIIARKNN